VEPLRSKVSAIQKDLSAALGERDALQDALGSSRDRVVSLEKQLGDAVKRGEDAKRAREESARAAFEGDAKFRAVLQAAVSLRFFKGLVGSGNGLGISICVGVRRYETNPRQLTGMFLSEVGARPGPMQGPCCYRRAKP